MEFTIKQIINTIEERFETQGKSFDILIKNVSPVNDAQADSIVWIDPKRADKTKLLRETKASLIIGDHSLLLDNDLIKSKVLVRVKNPRTIYAKILKSLLTENIVSKIDSSAIISPEAEINQDVSIGARTFIGKCKIGEGTIIDGNCYIYDNVTIGENVKIKAGAVIGGDGFGYVEDEDGTIIHFPHVGGVIIGNNVSVGSNTCIDRGTLGNTLIEDNVKIDNLVHIAHNVTIKNSCYITANTTIAGSATINEKSWLSPTSTIVDKIKVGSNVTIGAGAVQLRSTRNNVTHVGNPAVSIK